MPSKRGPRSSSSAANTACRSNASTPFSRMKHAIGAPNSRRPGADEGNRQDRHRTEFGPIPKPRPNEREMIRQSTTPPSTERRPKRRNRVLLGGLISYAGGNHNFT